MLLFTIQPASGGTRRGTDLRPPQRQSRAPEDLLLIWVTAVGAHFPTKALTPDQTPAPRLSASWQGVTLMGEASPEAQAHLQSLW